MVFVHMLQDSLDALGLGRFGFHFKWHTFAFHPDEEVQLKARVLQEVVQALLLLVKSVCHQILEDGAFESSQVALQDIRPGPRAQHLDEQTDICRVNLEHIVFGIAFHRETGNIGIVAAADNAGVFQPLKRAKIGFTSSAGLNLAVLEFLVLLGQLLGDGIEALADMGLVFVRSILNHIVAVLLQDALVFLTDGVHIIGGQECVDGGGETTNSDIEVQILPHGHVDSFRNRRFLRVELPESLDDIRIHTVGPEELLEVQRVHLDDVLAAYRNRVDSQIFLLNHLATPFLELIAVALDAQQGASGNHVKAAVLFEELERSPGLGAFLDFIKDQAGLFGDELDALDLRRQVEQNAVHIL